MNVGVKNNKLLKAGELAKRFGMLASTIRYYTNIGLLCADGRSQGGYNLYDLENAGKILTEVRKLKKKRFTLEEIKEKLMELK